MSDSQEKDEERFLTRWSRRKVASRRADPEENPVVSSPAASDVANTGGPPEPAATDPVLPPIDALHGLESEYREFLRPGVDETLRRTALGKLFQDPHFNVMDGLDTYIDDYTKADPISKDALKSLNQARGLIFDRIDEHREAAGTDTDPAPVSKQPALRAPEPLAPASSAGEGETAADDAAPSGPSRPGAPV